MRTVVIVGDGIAGVTPADALRREGYDGRIVMIGDERHEPYTRPPLSKGVLLGAETLESVTLASLPEGVELLTGTRAAALDTRARAVLTEDGGRLDFDGLVIATGSRPRTIRPGGDGETVLRSLDDAVALQRSMAQASTMLIIGGGFLGMEIASIASRHGLGVTVVDMVPHLERQFGRDLAARMTSAAVAQGAELVVAEGGITPVGDGPLTAVRTRDGRELTADVVVSAVGDVPNREWLASAGLAGPHGVAVDERCRVADGIVAAGDVAVFGGRRTPHWGAAIDQARIAAAALVHGDEAPPYRPSGYFWTEQWGFDIKICGEIQDGVREEVVDGSWDDDSVVVRYLRGEEPVAAASVNRRYPVVKLRRLVQAAVHA